MVSDLRALIREAIATEWHRRIAEQIADTPAGHVDALTDAVVERLSDFSPPGAQRTPAPCPFFVCAIGGLREPGAR
ncbi:hypothetical protein [Micromonospora sp. NPDC047730]|uniref:hypothetical protein n=1 Tax=Micromonospora sp. NPDC047730 TaxID=3364253 RepID=UPI003712713B